MILHLKIKKVILFSAINFLLQGNTLIASTIVIDASRQLVVNANDLEQLQYILRTNAVAEFDESDLSLLVNTQDLETTNHEIESKSKIVIQEIANVLANIECRLYQCGNQNCIGFKDYDSLQSKADYGPRTVQRKLTWIGTKLHIEEPVIIRDASSEPSGNGFYFNTITCTDEAQLLGGLPYYLFDELSVVGIRLKVIHGTGDQPTACSEEYDPSWVGGLERLRKSFPHGNLATSYGIQILAPLAASYYAGPAYSYAVQAGVSGALHVMSTSPIGLSEGESRRYAWTQIAPQFMPDATKLRLELERLLESLNSSFLRKKEKIYGPNIKVIQKMTLDIESGLKKMKRDEQAESQSNLLQLADQKSPIQILEARMTVLKSVLGFPTDLFVISLEDTLEGLDRFYQTHFYEASFQDELTKLMLQIQENSLGMSVETKGIYILGKPGTGKSTILKGIKDIFPHLPIIEISMSGKKFEDFLTELDARLSQLKVINPVVLIDEAGDMLGGKLSGGGRNPFGPPVDPVSTFKSYTGNTEESKIPAVGLSQMWRNGGYFSEEIQPFHDASRVMWVLTGNHPIVDEALARRFPTIEMTRVPREIRAKIANTFLQKAAIRESDLNPDQRGKYLEILSYDEIHNDGVAILENVITAFAFWVRNGSLSVFKNGLKFDVENTFRKYVVCFDCTPEPKTKESTEVSSELR